MDYFSYNEGKDLMPEGAFKISPSRLSRFFDDSANWYREALLGEEPKFTGSTSSVLGTCVHGLAAMHTQEGIFDESKVEAYLDTITDPEIDLNHIRRQYPIMSRKLVDQFTSRTAGQSELFFYEEVLPGIGVGGSIDLLCPTQVVDYKTTGSLSAPDKVSRNYYFQQMAYVWLARKKGYNIDSFKIVYITTHETGRKSETTGKPLKDYPCTVTEVIHRVTGEDMLLIESVIKLVAESVQAFKEKPEIRHLLAKDYRLKERTSVLFSNN